MPDLERRYDVFVSHASEDKEAVAKPLALALERMGLKVWYDEAVLSVGDSLSSRIDQGLANARYGIVILSKVFFEKGWPQYELAGLKARQIRGEQVIIPVWHGVDIDYIISKSPPLADLLSVQTSDLSVEKIAESIFYKISTEAYSPWLLRIGEGAFNYIAGNTYIDRKDKQRSAIGGLKSFYEAIEGFVNYQQLVSRFGGKIFVSGPHTDTSLNLVSLNSFGHYNLDFVRWIGRNVLMLISKRQIVQSTQAIYDAVLREPAIMYYSIYKFLDNNKSAFDAIRSDYKIRLDNNSLPEQYYHNASWVREPRTLALSLVVAINSRFDVNNAAVAIYFWVRRSLDGSAAEIFSTLHAVIKAYDHATLFNMNTFTDWVVEEGEISKSQLGRAISHKEGYNP